MLPVYVKQPGVVAISCAYSIYHHARPARARPPASSAAYQLFSAVHDLATAGLYGFGAAVVQRQGPGWTALIGGGGDGNKDLTSRYLVPAEQYALIGAGGLHVVSLAVGTYLALMFHRIARMPPDLNPLEDHLTRRAHKRNTSSVATTATWESLASSDGSSTGRISARLEQHRRSGAPYEDLARPPSIPFMHTRTGSRDSGASGSNPGSPTSNPSRDSRSDLPSRQYQIVPSNAPPPPSSRNSVPAPPSSASNGNTTNTNIANKRMSAPAMQQQQQQEKRDSHVEIPGLSDRYGDRDPDLLGPPSPLEPLTPRPLSAASVQTADYSHNNASPTRTETPRAPRFTETWYASESLVHRTQERRRALDREERQREKQQQQQQQQQKKKNQWQRDSRAYEALAQPYDIDEDDELDSDRENSMIRADFSDYEDGLSDDDDDESMLPHPLRAHPPSKQARVDANANANAAPSTTPPSRPRAKMPFGLGGGAALSEVSLNARTASGSRDIADQSRNSNSNSNGWRGRNRDSSIQPEEGLFYSRPYGDLKPATPPVMIGRGTAAAGGGGGQRQVSSGHDYYDLGSGNTSYRRNVSGKIAEEGLGGPAYAAAARGGDPRSAILKGLVASMS